MLLLLLTHTELLPGFMLDGVQPGDPFATLLPMGDDIIEADICPYGYYNDGTVYSCKR